MWVGVGWIQRALGEIESLKEHKGDVAGVEHIDWPFV